MPRRASAWPRRRSASRSACSSSTSASASAAANSSTLDQPGVRRTRRHAVARGRLSQRARIHRDRAPVRRASSCAGSTNTDGGGSSKERACSRARSSTRWIISTAVLFLHRLRGDPARDHRAKNSQARTAADAGDGAPHRIFRHARVRGSRRSTRLLSSSHPVVTVVSRSRTGRAGADSGSRASPVKMTAATPRRARSSAGACARTRSCRGAGRGAHRPRGGRRIRTDPS